MSPVTPPPLILASTSPYRRQLLRRLVADFQQVAPGVDESAIQATEPDPYRLARVLARAKAAAVAAHRPEAVVIGSDQLAIADGHILGKPGSVERAVSQLSLLAGTSHELVTAVCVLGPGDAISEHCDTTRLVMRPLARPALERYVAADHPLDCAGAYKLEERGIGLFERIESADHSAITGLPLLALTAILSLRGYTVP